MTQKTVTAPLADRVAFFRAQSAAITFTMARDAVVYLLSNNISSNNPIHDPLVTAALILYARPFQQKQPLRLSPDILKGEHRSFHDFLMTCRNKFAAHTDLDGPITDSGWLVNELAGRTKDGLTIFGITIVVPDLKLILAHLELVQPMVETEARSIWAKYFKGVRVPNGVSIVNLEEGIAPFLIPHPNSDSGAIPPIALPLSS